MDWRNMSRESRIGDEARAFRETRATDSVKVFQLRNLHGISLHKFPRPISGFDIFLACLLANKAMLINSTAAITSTSFSFHSRENVAGSSKSVSTISFILVVGSCSMQG